MQIFLRGALPYIILLIHGWIVTETGAVAQLGERDVRNVEARGSIPLSSTVLYQKSPF
jgi:hypothetical protein